jgi:hypothetical protein
MTYDYLPGDPLGIDDVRPIWLDVMQCGVSEFNPPKQSGSFTSTSFPWQSDVDGELLGMVGHLHDGGLRLMVEADGVPACNSDASYGDSKEFVESDVMGFANEAPSTHLSRMGVCTKGTLAVKKVTKGQRWVIKAEYDYGKHKGLTNDAGKQMHVMGIALAFVRKEI